MYRTLKTPLITLKRKNQLTISSFNHVSAYDNKNQVYIISPLIVERKLAEIQAESVTPGGLQSKMIKLCLLMKKCLIFFSNNLSWIQI